MSRTAPFEAILRGAGPLAGDRSVPGDKSISHRAALLGALARGRTTIENYADNRDCAATLACVEALGAAVRVDGDRVAIDGVGVGGMRRLASLDAQNSGTTMRLVAGAVAGARSVVEIAGDESLTRRPMERVARPLRAMGADVETTGGRPPIVVRGRNPLRAVEHAPERPSAQVKSAVLVAGLAADGRTTVLEPVRTRDHTERLLRAFGAPLSVDERGAAVEGPSELVATHVEVPGDLSSAVFLLVAALLVPGSDLVVRGVGLNPTRSRILEILSDLGADVEIARRVDGSEPRGDVRARYTGALGAKGRLDLGAREIAESIDEIPALAVLAACSANGIRFDGARELRAKESDRIGAIAEGLGRMGAEVETWDDGFEVRGGARLRGARVRSWGDHRIAMALACVALVADGETVVEGAEAASVSFPGFYDALPEGAAEVAGRDGE